jgi:D-glycero-D-manno-heptose 1,7-bisphosphate phosphatase
MQSDYKKFVFLDRDGVINVERGEYTTAIEQWQWAEGALEGIRLLTEAGFSIIVITNQACISKGIQTEEGLAKLHGYMIAVIRENRGDILRIYHCPHWTPDACDCRKPEPGMLLRAIEDFTIDSGSTFFIGDAGSDMEAGRRAGVKTLFITGSKASEGFSDVIQSDFRAGNLLEAAEIVIQKGQSPILV